jgi:hypothetical protein
MQNNVVAIFLRVDVRVFGCISGRYEKNPMRRCCRMHRHLMLHGISYILPVLNRIRNLRQDQPEMQQRFGICMAQNLPAPLPSKFKLMSEAFL